MDGIRLLLPGDDELVRGGHADRCRARRSCTLDANVAQHRAIAKPADMQAGRPVVGNVLRYTPQGTAFEVAVTRRDGWVVLRVDDAGPGIADPDRALRRGVSDHGSTGLGLDIVRRVTQATGGSVNIGRARLGGASVIMMFEDAEEPPPPASRFGVIGRLAREPRKTFDRRRR